MYQLRCLGEASLRSPAGQLVHFRSRKHFALLTYLALNADRAHRRERLAGLLWSDSEDSKARHSLSQALYAVRRLLDGAVRIEGEDLELELDGLQVDALELERRLRGGDPTAAANLFRGDFLEGFWLRGAQGFEEWAVRERARVGALAREALRGSIRAARDRCDWHEVRQHAQRLVQLDPYDETAYAELMRALWMLGDRAAALDRYAELKHVLKSELQAHPSRDTEALADRIRERPVRGGWANRRLLREPAGPQFSDPPFVGRQTELAALAQEWRVVLTGESRAAAVVGPAGIGKTRLADEFLKSLELNDVTILQARCYEAEQTLPYGPVAEALRQGVDQLDLSDVKPLWLAELARIVPEVCTRYGELPAPSTLDAEGSRRRLYEGIAQVLRSACESRPVILFVDDLQWADDSSLALLHYLHRRVTNGLYLLTAHRPEDIGAVDTARRASLLANESPLRRSVRVGALDPEASSDLLSALVADASDEGALASLREMSGGNPFFAIELARNLDEEAQTAGPSRPPVPNSIKSLFQRRFAGLSDHGMMVLRQAACLGSRIGHGVLNAAVALPPRELDAALRELVRAGLLSEEDGRIRFRHDLIREIAWSQVAAGLRGSLHRRAARALIRSRGAAGEIALHLSAAGDERRAHAWASRGARVAEGVFALEEAADLLELAIGHAPDESSRMRLVARLGKLYLYMREYAKARPLLRQRLACVGRNGRSRLKEFEARRDLLFVDVYSSAITVEESGKALKALYDELAASGEPAPRLEAELLGALFWAAARSFDPKLAEETIARIRTLHMRSDDPAVRCRTARSLGIYECYKGRLEEAETLLRQALQWSKDTGDETAVIDSYIGLTALLFRVMRVDLAEEVLAAALPLAERSADPARLVSIICNCAVCHMHLRHLEAASRLLKQAEQTLETSGHVPDSIPSVAYNLGFVMYVRGNVSLAEANWRRALAVSDAGAVLPVKQESLAALGSSALRRGQVREARAFAAESLRLARRGRFLADERSGLEELLARLRFEAGQTKKALTKLAQKAEFARESDIPLYLTAQLTRIELLIRAKCRAEALQVHKQMLAVAGSLGATWWLAQADAMLKKTRS